MFRSLRPLCDTHMTGLMSSLQVAWISPVLTNTSPRRAASLMLFGVGLELSMRKGAAWWITSRSRKDNGDADSRHAQGAAACPDYL